MPLATTIQDHPQRVSLALLCAVLLHVGLTVLTPMPFVWDGLLAQQSSDVVAVYLGLAGIAAIISGFAGVVVVFGLSSGSVAFRSFRRATGGALKANWVTPTAESLLAAVLALSSSLAYFANMHALSAWVFEFAVLLLVHSGARLMWLLVYMMRLVKVDDDNAAAKSDAPDLDEVFRNS